MAHGEKPVAKVVVADDLQDDDGTTHSVTSSADVDLPEEATRAFAAAVDAAAARLRTSLLDASVTTLRAANDRIARRKRQEAKATVPDPD